MGECAGVKDPQPGEWWQYTDDEYPKGFRLFIVGRKLNGSLICQNSSGAADIYTVSGDEWRHLPNCTGFDWVEETYPQYWTSLDNPETSDIVYAIQTGPAERGDFSYVHVDGSVWEAGDNCRWSATGRDRITKEQAEELREERRQNEWVVQDRVAARPGIDERRFTHLSELRPHSWGEVKASYSAGLMHGDVKNNERIEVRCRRKYLPPLPEEKVGSSPFTAQEIEHERARRDAEFACETGRMDPSAAFNYMRATENSSREIDAAGQDVPKKRKEDVLFHEVVIFRLGGRQLAWMENPGGMETTGNVRRVMIEVRNDRSA
jgi:hypothetical protein